MYMVFQGSNCRVPTYATYTTVGALKLNVCEAMVYAVVNIILSIPRMIFTRMFRERMQF